MSAKKLSSKAYELAPGEVYEPYTAGQRLPEFTIKAPMHEQLVQMARALKRQIEQA